MNDKPIIVCPHCGAPNRVPQQRLAEQPKCGSCKQALFDGHPVALTAANFATMISRTEIPVLVDFWAEWCGPCKMMAPIFAQAAARLEPRVRLAKLDTEAAQAVAAQYNIRSIPTLVLFRNGRELNRLSGAVDLPNLLNWVNSQL